MAKTLRVTQRSVKRWRRAWCEGGAAALASAGPHALPRLSPARFAHLEAELERGPPIHGFTGQRWTLMRIKTLPGRKIRGSRWRLESTASCHRPAWR